MEPEHELMGGFSLQTVPQEVQHKFRKRPLRLQGRPNQTVQDMVCVPAVFKDCQTI